MNEVELRNEMIRLYLPPRSLSLAEIGAQFGVTKQAVQRRLQRAGIARRGMNEERQARYPAWVKANRREIERALANLGGSALATSKHLHVPYSWVLRFAHEHNGR